MKKLTILLFITLALLIQGCGSFEETICKETEGQERNGLVYLPNQQEPFTGNNLCKYENGQIKREGYYKDGKRDGKWTTWRRNGEIWSERNYKDGKSDGKWTDWYVDGQKTIETNYKDGKMDGKFTWWHENGQKFQEGNNKDGKKDGKWTKWRRNGEIQEEENYKDGVNSAPAPQAPPPIVNDIESIPEELRDPLGKEIQHLIDVTSKIRKLRISTNGIPGTIEYDEDNFFIEGTLTTQWQSKQGVSRELTIKGIRADEGTVIVQLKVTPGTNAAFEDLLHVVPRDSSVVLIDTNGHKYPPIGYYIGDDKRMQLSLTPSTPIRTISEIPLHILTSSNKKNMTLLFQVTKGQWIKEFRVGDITIGTCNVQANSSRF